MLGYYKDYHQSVAVGALVALRHLLVFRKSLQLLVQVTFLRKHDLRQKRTEMEEDFHDHEFVSSNKLDLPLSKYDATNDLDLSQSKSFFVISFLCSSNKSSIFRSHESYEACVQSTGKQRLFLD
jgi:hypothetical protein